MNLPHSAVILKSATALNRLMQASRQALLLAALLVISLPTALAIESIGEPNYTTNDWFEYQGYTEQLVNQLSDAWQDEENFEGIALTTREELRVKQLGTESCTILTWSGDCVKAQITHLVNFTVDWQDNTTNYENDTLNMSISYTATHWKSRGTEGWEKLDTTTLTITQFSGGGEDNFLEHELQEIALTRRTGTFPETIQIGELWDVEKSVQVSGLERVRENRGLWSENEYNRSTITQLSYQVLGERGVYYGVDNTKLHDTLAVQRVDLGDNTTTIDFFLEDGFLAHTETWHNGTLLLSATLTDYRYYVNEPHSSSMSTNWLLPTVLTCMVILVIIGAGATWFGISTVPRTRVETDIVSTLDRVGDSSDSGSKKKKGSGLMEMAQEKKYDVKEIEAKIDSLDDIDES